MSFPSILIVAGDPSGDKHASSVVRKLRLKFPESRVWGIGGPLMKKEGFEPVFPFEPFNKMGFLEVVSHLPFFLRAKRKLIKKMRQSKPDCLICVDYPGFNMLLMKEAKKMGIPVFWYIAPMVWAWKKKRAEELGRCCAHIGCIFPFEVDYFAPYTKNVSFVGNPLVEEIAFRKREIDKKAPVVAIIPGSRAQEIEKMLVPMIEAYKIFKARFPKARGIVSQCRPFPESVDGKLKEAGLEVFTGPLQELLGKVDLAMVTSGTATLETALCGVPMVIVYKTSSVSYAIYKLLVKVSFIGLPNIIANEKVVPECIQDDAEPQKIADCLGEYIDNEEKLSLTMQKFETIRSTLGFYNPSVKIAEIVSTILGSDT